MKTLKFTKNGSTEKKPVFKEITVSYGIRRVSDGVIFYALYPKAASVQVAGDFNNWQPERAPMRRIDEHGTWEIKISLVPGTYRYRLVVDGRWEQDPFNDKTEPNQYGGLNSILKV
jgi:1,4-alpha-glucan branching enzyme